MNIAMFVLGVTSLAAIAGLSAWIIFDAVTEQRHRILAALRGEPIPPAASVAPHATARSPQLRGDEAAAEPALQVALRLHVPAPRQGGGTLPHVDLAHGVQVTDLPVGASCGVLLGEKLDRWSPYTLTVAFRVGHILRHCAQFLLDLVLRPLLMWHDHTPSGPLRGQVGLQRDAAQAEGEA